MRFSVFAAATMVAALPAAPALAHCRTVHHRIHHAAWHAPVRRHVVRYAGCACRTHVAYRRAAYRPAAYPVVYRRPRVVEVTYERPLPVYRPYPVVYAEPIYRPHRVFYGPRFYGEHFYRERFYGRHFGGPRFYGAGFHDGHRFGFEHRHRGWR